MKYGVQIRQMAKRMGVNQKIDSLYDMTANVINNRYGTIKREFCLLEQELNELLSGTSLDDDKVKGICEHYIFIDSLLEHMFDITIECQDIFKAEIEEISRIYVQATACFSESGRDEIIGKSFCFVSKFRNDYYNWIEDFIALNIDELADIHKRMGEGLEYVYNAIDDDCSSVEIMEEVRRRGNYIASAKQLEELAIENGYHFKSQNGSHKKYENEKSKKCVIIPTHTKDLGVGISFAIQKQILANAI